MKNLALTLFLVCSFIFTSIAQNEADKIIGTWMTGEKKGKITIYKKGNKYYGKLSWLKDPNDKNGNPLKDKENPDESLRDRPILGLEILSGFEYDDDLEWEDGEIYDPESGNVYNCEMELSEDGNTLYVRGYIGYSWMGLGRTQEWTRTK